MSEQKKKKRLDEVKFISIKYNNYYQNSEGLISNMTKIGNIYIYQITVTRDIKDRFEPLYDLKYEDMVFDETKTIKHKTFDELVNFIKKQKLIFYEEECVELVLTNAINRHHENKIYNDIQFLVKEKKDFMKEKLPMIPI